MQVVHAKGCVPTITTLGEHKHMYFFYICLFHITIHSTLFRDINESLLYLTDSDEEDPFFLMSPSAAKAKERGSVGQCLLADPLLLLAVVGGGSWGRCIVDQGQKLPSSPHQRRIGPQKKSTPVSWAAPSLKSADTCSKGRPQLSKQR